MEDDRNVPRWSVFFGLVEGRPQRQLLGAFHLNMYRAIVRKADVMCHVRTVRATRVLLASARFEPLLSEEGDYLALTYLALVLRPAADL